MSSAAQVDFAKSSSLRHRNARTLRAYMALRNQDIAQRIKDLREQRGNPPQPIVAAAVGVSLRTYQNWEGADAKPEYRNLENLAAYFGVSEQFILSGNTNPQEDPVVVSETVDAGFVEFRQHVDQMNRKLDANQRRLDEILARLAPVEFANALEALEDQPAPSAEQREEPAQDEDDPDSEARG